MRPNLETMVFTVLAVVSYNYNGLWGLGVFTLGWLLFDFMRYLVAAARGLHAARRGGAQARSYHVD